MPELFSVDPAFEACSLAAGELPLCHVRLQDDARFPWLILIPRRAGLVELEDLTAEERQQLMEEVLLAGRIVRSLGEVTKLNVGALGNITRQLHVHVVGRRDGDAAWPGPVWGVAGAAAYEDRAAVLTSVRALLPTP